MWASFASLLKRLIAIFLSITPLRNVEYSMGLRPSNRHKHGNLKVSDTSFHKARYLPLHCRMVVDTYLYLRSTNILTKSTGTDGEHNTFSALYIAELFVDGHMASLHPVIRHTERASALNFCILYSYSCTAVDPQNS